MPAATDSPQPPRRRATAPGRRWLRRLLWLVGGVFTLVALLGGAAWLLAGDALGGVVDGARLERAQASPNWRDGRFVNRLPRHDGSYVEILRRFFWGGEEHREPAEPPPVLARSGTDYAIGTPSGLRVTWLGHSTLLLEVEGARFLIDPVWGERVSPFSFAGPKRFYPPPLPLGALPAIDAVVISHDHYDHLDTPTIKALSGLVARLIVPIGVGAHLERWGVDPSRIEELDWWDSTRVAGVTLTATPARHFSGRGVGDADRTLWAGWAFTGEVRRAFYSGDTAFDSFFQTIGERLGPFDLTMLEVGAYDALWADVHLGPEQAVLAHQQLRGKVMLPVHWGLFDLGLHGWTEPVERALVAARAAGVHVVTPQPGGIVIPVTIDGRVAEQSDVVPWWPSLPWRTVDEAPAWSSGVSRDR